MASFSCFGNLSLCQHKTSWHSYIKLSLHVIVKALYGLGRGFFCLVSPTPTTWKILSQYLLNEWMIFRYGLLCLLFPRTFLMFSPVKEKSSLFWKKTKWNLISLVIFFLPSDIKKTERTELNIHSYEILFN